MSLFRAGSGNSMARALMALLVASTCVAVIRSKEFNTPMSVAVTGIAGTLAGVWGLSKSKWRSDTPEPPK